jgi:hypothetical protein
VSEREKTLGETRVRTSFNPSHENAIDIIKATCAELIDRCESLKDKDPRLAAIAQTKFEDACHWAVKLATTGK